MKRLLTFLLLLASSSLTLVDAAPPIPGWLSWRGPEQNSVSRETGLPTKIDAKSPLWTADFPGQSTPVIARGRLYINGYLGDGSDLQEAVSCFDATTGAKLWEHRENDFLSDTIYLRYATSAPTIDPETGNIYVQQTQGLLMCFNPEGKLLWKHSLMEEFGRLTFPNSRTASPVVDRDLVITRGITSSWGSHGAAGDRFYAYDKKSGDLVWSSAPADRPQDNTFSHPYMDFWNGKRVLYSAGGDSSIFALNARTGEPLWRFPFAKAGTKGGINAGLVRFRDFLIGVHESENIDSSEIGRMAAFRIPKTATPSNSVTPQVFGAAEFEAWRLSGVGALASSPVVVDDRIYQVNGTGDLAGIDAATGKLLWKKKLGVEQRQSSPFFADGTLYVAMYIGALATGDSQSAESAGSNGELFVLRPRADGVEELSRTQLTGRCYGSPIGYNGKIYVQTDRKLYCFGRAENNPVLAAAEAKVLALERPWPAPGPAAQLQAIPYEVLLRPGQTQSIRVRSLDTNGFVVSESLDLKSLKWEPFIPPTALVKATMHGHFNSDGQLVADSKPAPSAGQFKCSHNSLAGYIKGRVLPEAPIQYDFESFELANTTTNSVEPPTPFAYPPLPWNACRFRFEVRDKDGTKALIKTIENKLLQRGQIFIGHPNMHNYTIEADVLSEGTRRKMSEVGLINQRYAVVLKGNAQEIEINSNQERLKHSVPFRWSPNTWYHLKVRVDTQPDGAGIVRGKAWKKGDAEPDSWLIEFTHRHAHEEGSPGFFAFAPQEQRVAIDNIQVTAN